MNKKLILAGAVGFAALIQAGVAVGQASTTTTAPPKAFARCAACHAVKAGAPHGLGPNLVGVAGKTAATRPGYNYSSALKNSGKTWTREAMIAYITNPAAVVPGTKMMRPATMSPAEQLEVARYLEGLK